ncbi:MAG: lipopolysaccharide heptosyltransferase II [Acidobacteria bacterium]|nr:lipopolysaccharide heptosyltransferase II [Acidobacteriota bacterium]
MSDPARVLVVAPNWLGDTVMALPAISDVRHRFPSARLVVAARRAVADIFRLVPFVDELVALQWSGRWWERGVFAGDAGRLRPLGADLAILLPNSFAAAWLASRAAIPARWGYRSDMRAPLLSRAVRRPKGRLHQGAYYQHLTRALGIESGPLEPALTVPAGAAAAARRHLLDRGWDGARPVIAFAPGAAYGTAKRWLPRYVARLARDLVRGRQATCVMVGSRRDASTARDVVNMIEADAARRVIDLTGQTTVEMLAGVLGIATACVSNDSGAMHMAAAVGTPLVALFGPTREYETAPLTRSGRRAEVLTHPVWCRPCMLRECPIDHRCMKGITPDRVRAALTPLLSSTT